jgi:hypothetical protein
MACGYLVSSILFISFNPIQLSIRKLIRLIRFDFHRRSRLLADALVTWGFGLVSITLMRFATGDNGIGIYNKIGFLFGPVTLITVFLTLGLQAEVVRTKGHLATRHKALLISISIFPILWLTVVSRVPDHLLVAYLGQPTSEIFINSKPFAVSASLALSVEVLILFMRGYGKFSEILVIRFASGVILMITSIFLLIQKSSLENFIWAIGLSNLIALIAILLSLRTRNAHNF